MLVPVANASEKLGRRYVVILDDLATRRYFEGLDARVPSDRMVINQNVRGVAQVRQRRSGRLYRIGRHTRALSKNRDFVSALAQHAAHCEYVVAHSIGRSERGRENRDASHRGLRATTA